MTEQKQKTPGQLELEEAIEAMKKESMENYRRVIEESKKSEQTSHQPDSQPHDCTSSTATAPETPPPSNEQPSK